MHELGRRYWLNLLAEGGDGEAVDAGEKASVAPFERAGGAAEVAAKDGSGGFEAEERSFEGGEGGMGTINCLVNRFRRRLYFAVNRYVGSFRIA